MTGALCDVIISEMSKQSLPEFATDAAQCLYDLATFRISNENVVLSVEDEIKELLNLNNENTLRARRQHFTVPNTQDEDYREQFFELSIGRTLLAGIRHKNGSKDKPFVHALLGFMPTAEDIESLKYFALEQYQKFKPKFLSIWLRPSLQLDISADKLVPSRQYVVGSAGAIRKMQRPSGYDRVSLEKITGDFDFKWYSEAYDDFHRQRPELKEWVPITDRESIDRCLSDQLLYKVFVDGVHAGLIGAQSEPLFGRPSVYVTELLLISKFKSQGLAAALQRKFIDELPPNIDLIWGTIDAKNLPSLKTALRVGRFPIRSEYFIGLA